MDRRLLIIEDTAPTRVLLKSILRKFGYNQVDEANNGEEGLSKLKLRNYDLVLCDWNMPVMSGMELLEAMKADETLKNVPFVLVTGESEKSQVVSAIQKGVKGYVTKPFTPKSIEQMLQQIFGTEKE